MSLREVLWLARTYYRIGRSKGMRRRHALRYARYWVLFRYAQATGP